MNTSAPLFTVAIITFNVQDKLRVCLDSVRRFLPDIPVHVWDNGSTDGTLEMMRSGYAYVHYHRSNENLYFARGCNELIASCTTRYALLMNADIKLLDASVTGIVDYMESRRELIAVSPSITDHGLLRHMSSGIITPLRCIIRDSFFGMPFRSGRGFRTLNGSDIDPHSVFDAAKVTNCCCMIRCSHFLTIGGFSRRQLLYWTEEDFAVRVLRSGLKQSVYGKSIVEHDHGSSTKKLPAKLVRAIFVHDRIAYMRSLYGMVSAFVVELALVRPKIWNSIIEYYSYVSSLKVIAHLKKIVAAQGPSPK